MEEMKHCIKVRKENKFPDELESENNPVPRGVIVERMEVGMQMFQGKGGELGQLSQSLAGGAFR